MKRILIVEDNDLNLKLMESILDSNGYELQSAMSGEAGIELISENSFDLVLMDLQLPGIDGFATTEQVRTLANGKSVPIVAVTGNATAADREKCLQSGFSDFLKKPFRIDALLNMVNQHLPE